jgi:hypothetical protein
MHLNAHNIAYRYGTNRGWKIRPVERFSEQVGGNTSFPVLFLSNKFDPITPLVNAHAMSKLFPGSGLLVQNAIGVRHGLVYLSFSMILIVLDV